MTAIWLSYSLIEARFPSKRNRLRCVRCVNENRIPIGCKRQPIGMLGHSSGNHDWLLASAIACVSCGFHLRNARNAIDCVWMETGLEKGWITTIQRIDKSQKYETITQLTGRPNAKVRSK